MCGIFFSIGFQNISPQVIDSVAHRGPDGRGWNEFTSPQGPVIMAHRRLAIVDLSKDGHQPMSREDGRYWITYNGEIYNYLEIRKELECLGHRFNTKTDTEVLLASYLHWGHECLNRFNGMFSFVIWDNLTKKIFVARDRFGVKPIYYYKENNKIAFASEIKQFCSIKSFTAVANKKIICGYLYDGISDDKRETFFNNVYQVMPGEMVNIALNDYDLKFFTWYDISNCKQNVVNSFDVAVQEFYQLLEDSICLRLRSDVRMGTSLSGGLDSSAILCLLSKENKLNEYKRNLESFSACFPGFALDESKYIDEITKVTNITNNKITFDFKNVLDIKDKVFYMHDEPFGSSSGFAQWFVYEEAHKKNVKVILDGQGSDEYLAGYHSMFIGKIIGFLKFKAFFSLLKCMWKLKKEYSYKIKTQFLDILFYTNPFLYSFVHKMFGKKIAPNWLQNEILQEYIFLTPKLESIDNVINSISTLSVWYLKKSIPKLLRCADRNSMAHSIESRLPFMDYRIIEKVLSYDDSYKINNTLETKFLLRESMKNVIPSLILERKDKIGFASPENIWMTNNNSSFIESYITNNINDFTEIFNVDKLKQHVKNKIKYGPSMYDNSVWRIFCFINWAKIFNIRF